MRRIIASLVVVAAVWAAAVPMSGCSKKLLPPATGNQAPKTTVFIQGPVDTVNHVVHLYWYGTDADGYVKGYEVKLVNPADTAAVDSAWRYTTLTDSVVTVLAPNGFTGAVFSVRAVDDKGLRDPSPAVEAFKFGNTPPVVKLTTKPSATDQSNDTYPAVTVAWSISDPDGNASKVVCHVWLDRMTGPPILATGGTISLPTSAFLINGAFVAGARTLYIQGVDDGGMAGPIDSVTWNVRKPVAGTRARLLVIDEMAKTDPNRAATDSLYIRAAHLVGVAADQIGYINIGTGGVAPFKSAADLANTMALFESVVWFRGYTTSTTPSTVLLKYQDGVGSYLDNGGKIYLESQVLTQGFTTQGALQAPFMNSFLNSDGVFNFASAPDSSADYAVNSGAKFYCPTFGGTPAIGDSLQARGIIAHMRGFRVRDNADVYVYAKAGALSPANSIPMPVAVNVPTRKNGTLTGGRIIANSVAVFATNTTFAARFCVDVMRQLGLAQ